MITINHRAFEQREKYLTELDQLTSKAVMSDRDSKRHAFLLSAIKALGEGVKASELQRFEKNRLLRMAGMPGLPDDSSLGFLDRETETEYRSWGLTGKCEPTHVPDDREVRANEAGQQSITYTKLSQGGAFVPQGMYSRVAESMKQYDELFDENFSNVIETETGNTFPYPSIDDVSSAAAQVGEAVQSIEQDIPNFGTNELGAWSFRTNLVHVTRELLQDSNFPIGAVLERAFSIQLARGCGAALATGSGVNSPTGLITGLLGAGASIVVASGSSTNTGGAETGSTSIGTVDLGNLVAKTNETYRRGAAFAMNDATYQYLLQLLDKMGRPVWPTLELRREAAMGDRPNIWGWPIAICPSFPTIGNARNVVAFYNPNYFIQRRVPSSCYLRRFQELPGLIENDEVAFQMWLRVDSTVIAPNGSFAPGAILQAHS